MDKTSYTNPWDNNNIKRNQTTTWASTHASLRYHCMGPTPDIAGTKAGRTSILYTDHETNFKAGGQVLQVTSNVGFIMCARKCSALSRCHGFNFFKPHLQCELLEAQVSIPNPQEGWLYVGNIEWLQSMNLAPEMEGNPCDIKEKNVLLSSGNSHCVQSIPTNCQDPLILQGGEYTISPQRNRKYTVYCDFDTYRKPWTVIQRRVDGTVSFDRPWVDYKTGFGNLRGNFWLGNDNIHDILSAGKYTLRVDIESFDGEKFFAEYSTFHVACEDDKYRLTVQGHSGTAGDGLNRHNNLLFTTKDADNDLIRDKNCAQLRNGGWWFDSCYQSYLNGIYYLKHNAQDNSIIWNDSTKSYYVKSVCMKVRQNLD